MTPTATTATSSRESKKTGQGLTLALWFNGVMLALIALVLLGRGRSPFDSIMLSSSALAQQVQPIAGGAGFYLMPAQFAGNAWGCYVMDVDAQTLVAYVYDPAKPGTLRLAAARSFAMDRQLRNYNTTPSPYDVQKIVDLERDTARRPENLNSTTEPAVPNQ